MAIWPAPPCKTHPTCIGPFKINHLSAPRLPKRNPRAPNIKSRRTPDFQKWSQAQGSQRDHKMNQTSSQTNPNLETELDQHGTNLAPIFDSLIQSNTREKMAQRGQPKRRGAAVCRHEASSVIYRARLTATHRRPLLLG